MLEAEIRRRKQQRDILLMTHIVLGYPSFDTCRRVVEDMVRAGVDMMELQIPFSEPIGDGPVIVHANQKALAAGATVDRCLEVTSKLTREFSIPFLFMTYFNVAFRRGVEQFSREMREVGVKGAIILDLPYEEGAELLAAMAKDELEPIYIYAPTTSDTRKAEIAKRASGFIYCIARNGVTGAKTDFAAVDDHVQRCRKATQLPLALGFGVRDRADVASITGKVDIAVVGSETLRILDRDGVNGVRRFVESLRL